MGLYRPEDSISLVSSTLLALLRCRIPFSVRCDIFMQRSLGYLKFCGEPPLGRESSHAIIRAVKNFQVSPAATPPDTGRTKWDEICVILLTPLRLHRVWYVG
jgi:hypothetical protein